MGFDECLLQCVLALVAIAEHVPAVGQQRRMVTLEDRRKRLLVAGLRASHERSVVVADASAETIRPSEPWLSDGHDSAPARERAHTRD